MMARPSPEPRSMTKSFGVSLARSNIFSSVTNGVGTQTESLPGCPGTGSYGFFVAANCWADALKVSATILNAAANSTTRRILIKQRLPGELVTTGKNRYPGSSLPAFFQELEEASRGGFFGLAGNRHVPISGLGQALLQIPRRRRRMRGVAAGNDEGGQVHAHQVLGLGARRGVAVEERARQAGDDEPVALKVLPGIGLGEGAIVAKHGRPRPAARVFAERFAGRLRQRNHLGEAV